jgi:hypothetical protein
VGEEWGREGERERVLEGGEKGREREIKRKRG